MALHKAESVAIPALFIYRLHGTKIFVLFKTTSKMTAQMVLFKTTSKMAAQMVLLNFETYLKKRTVTNEYD